MKKVSTFEIIYWQDLKLLGYIGDSPNDSMPEHYNSFYFQNGTDRDYPLSTWIKLGAKVRSKIMAIGMMPISDLTTVLQNDYRWYDDVNDEDFDFEYARRTLATNAVEEIMQVNKLLYRKPLKDMLRIETIVLDFYKIEELKFAYNKNLW